MKPRAVCTTGASHKDDFRIGVGFSARSIAVYRRQDDEWCSSSTPRVTAGWLPRGGAAAAEGRSRADAAPNACLRTGVRDGAVHARASDLVDPTCPRSHLAPLTRVARWKPPASPRRHGEGTRPCRGGRGNSCPRTETLSRTNWSVFPDGDLAARPTRCTTPRAQLSGQRSRRTSQRGAPGSRRCEPWDTRGGSPNLGSASYPRGRSHRCQRADSCGNISLRGGTPASNPSSHLPPSLSVCMDHGWRWGNRFRPIFPRRKPRD